MVKKILSFIISLSVALSMLPVYADAAETGPDTPTCILTETLILSNEAAGDESKGFIWTPNEAGGGTLILENCYIQSSRGLFRFEHLEKDNSNIDIILRGKNIWETTSKQYGSLISAKNVESPNGEVWDESKYTISEEGEGSLEIRTNYDIESDLSPYVFGAGSITIESGDIETNISFCAILDDFNIHGGSLKIHTPPGAKKVPGIYTINGPVNISGGTVDIEVSNSGIVIAGIPAQDRGNQTINISGGDVNIKSFDFSCLHINSSDKEGEDTQSFNITGGNVTCYGELTVLYAKNVNIKGGGGSVPVVNVSTGENTTYPAIMPGTGKITISNSIVVADGIKGYDSPDSVMENSMIFNDSEGKVYGNVELESDFLAPKDSTLSVPEGATLTVPEETILSGPDGTPIKISSEGNIINNGTIILPEDNEEINSTGTGIIKKGDNLYTNDNEQLYTVTIKQKETEITEYYKEGDIINLVPEADTEDIRFKEWKAVPDTVVITDNKFIMPAEAVIVEAVFETFYPVTIKQPSGTVTKYYKEGEIISLVPEAAAEGNQFKEWKITPATIVITDNKFTMPAEAVNIETIYEKIPADEEIPLPTGSSPSTAPLPTGTSIPTGNPSTTKSPDSTQGSGGLSTYPVTSIENIIITISASPVLGGTVSGNTNAVKGENVTITATANAGYIFSEWTEDGKRVSADAKYTFKAEKNRTLVAVFKQNISGDGIQNAAPDKISVKNNIKTVSEVALPNGWEWSKKDSTKIIPAGGSVTATALYTAKYANSDENKDVNKDTDKDEDKDVNKDADKNTNKDTNLGDYNNNTSIVVTIIRDACEENSTVLYTMPGEYAPDCTTDGLGHTECKICGDIVKEGIKVPAAGHKEKAAINKAAINKDGSSIIKCTKCNEILSSTVISAIKNIKLSKNKDIYNKKIQHPSISVKDSKGSLLKEGTDYTISWANGMKKAGIYNVKIIFIGRYEGTKDKTYKIIPKGTSISKVKAGTKGFTLKWKKQTVQTTGYQIQYSTDKNFTKETTKKVTVKTKKTVSKLIKCDKTNKKYYVRIRTYKNVKVNGKVVKVFSGWSKIKTVKTKK